MKKILLSLTISALALYSCTEKSKNKEALVGTWKVSYRETGGTQIDVNTIAMSYTFMQDGKYEYKEAGSVSKGSWNANKAMDTISLVADEDRAETKYAVKELSDAGIKLDAFDKTSELRTILQLEKTK